MKIQLCACPRLESEECGAELALSAALPHCHYIIVLRMAAVTADAYESYCCMFSMSGPVIVER